MNMSTFKIRTGFLLVFNILFYNLLNAQTVDNDFQLRSELNLGFDLGKNLELSLTPEVRLNESLNIQKYMLETALTYKAVKGLNLKAGYRLVVNPRETKSTEYLSRIALSAEYGKKFDRWKPYIRFKYSNYTEDAPNTDFLRYRARLKYNIKNSKITPEISAEAYHDFSAGNFYKMRYSLSTKYKLNKNNDIELGYKLDYYLQENRNKHIINLGYHYNF